MSSGTGAGPEYQLAPTLLILKMESVAGISGICMVPENHRYSGSLPAPSWIASVDFHARFLKKSYLSGLGDRHCLQGKYFFGLVEEFCRPFMG